MDPFTLDKIEFKEIRRILSGFCSCSLGKELAEHVGPSRNPQVINDWLEQVSQMLRAVRDAGLPPFGGVADIREALHRATPGEGASAEDFARIASVLEGAGNVRTYLLGLPEELARLHELANQVGSFDREVEAIRAVVAPDAMILDDASPRLAELRRDAEATAKQIHDVIYGYLRDPEVAKLLQDSNVTLFGDRYVLPVRSENRGRLKGVVHGASNTGATVFVEPTASVELNNRLADLRDDERREIERLLHMLSVKIMGRREEIGATLHALAQIDLLSAKAQYAYQFEFTRPEVTERGPLQFAQARHPLLVDLAWRQERANVAPEARHAVVPIDVRLGQDFDILVITGSNTGGKTVALKTVALLAVMAQSGMYIPAQRGATMPTYRDIFLDVGDEQSLQQSLSTFGAHIKRIKYILRKTDSASLALLDELGSGTDPDEGAAIGQAVLDELRRVGCVAMVTTHLSALKAYAYNHERVDNASVEFDTATLSPTYHLRLGMPGESHAITVAQKLGLPKSLIASARHHLTEQSKQFRKAIMATAQARESAETARAEAQAARLAALTEQESYEAKLADLHRLKDDIEHWLANVGDMKKGDEVHVPSLGKKGHLARLELHRQIAVVDLDSLQMEVPLRDLMPDFGQNAVREQIAKMRQEILDQARQAEQAREEDRRRQEEFHRSVQRQKERARQFDTWLGAIARLKIGDEVPIARKPGVGKVVKADLPGLRVVVQTSEGEVQLMLQELFPQTGPFAQPYRPPPPEHRRPPRQEPQRVPQGQRAPQEGQRPGQGQRQRQGRPQPQPPHVDPNQPLRHRSPDSRAAKASLENLLKAKPGDQVYLVPFKKRATLIRINEDRQQAVVQSGVFEMELPLADLEPIAEPPPKPKPKKAPPPQPPKPQAAAAEQPASPPPAPAASAPEAPNVDAPPASS